MKAWFIQLMTLMVPIIVQAQPVGQFAKENTAAYVRNEKNYEITATITKDLVNNAAGKNSKILSEKFLVFDQLSDHSIYSITLAADVPDDKRPMKVYYKDEPGHVFVILEKKDTLTDIVISQSWGFYPIRPVSCLFFKNIKCKISDNGAREYNAAIRQNITKEQFDSIKSRAIILSAKKYKLNKYNCYDYALELFNSIEDVSDLSFEKVKFPFILGRGGSPCGLYKQLMKMKSSGYSPFNIQFGKFTSPTSGITTQSTYAINKF